MGKRLIDLLPGQIKEHPQEDALCFKENGVWRKYSSQECQDMVDKVSLALLTKGIKRGDKIAIISNNRPEWNFADLGCLQVGAIDVPLYPTMSDEEHAYIFGDAEIRFVFAENNELADKMKRVEALLDWEVEVYTFEDTMCCTYWKVLLDMADESLRPQLEEIKKTIREDDLATLIYTSGTTSMPKGVMLTHKNIISNVESCRKIMPIDHRHRAISFLPLCHVFERMICSYYLYTGVSVYYAESIEKIADNLKEVNPNYFTTVPRLLEKIYEKIMGIGRQLTGAKKAIFGWAIDVGNQYDNMGRNSSVYNFKLNLARKLVFHKWLEALGGECKGIMVGASALQPRLARIFSAAGVDVREGYGLTESSPVITVNRFEDGEFKFGTVGPAIPGVEVKISESGEILARGDNIMKGYYNKPKATAETLDEDGWLHTGDAGEIVDGHFLKITDRIKELYKTSGGKYVAPQPIENKMKESNFIEQIMVVGENRKFTSALIVPAFEFIKEWGKIHDVKLETKEEICNSEKVYERINEDVNQLCSRFGKIEQIKKFKLLPKEWSVDGGEYTPTMKLKRKNIRAKYQNEIEGIYI